MEDDLEIQSDAGNGVTIFWSDFLACQEIWILDPTWSLTNHTKSGLGTLHCTVQFICTQKLDLHAIQLWGSTAPAGCHQELPGSGKQWGGVAPDQGVVGVTQLFRRLAKTSLVCCWSVGL